MLTTFIVVFLLSYAWHAMGITIGYHRLLSHRSFVCNKAVEYFWVLAGYLAFEGSPIWWATIHRAHHRYVDTPLDPHSPRIGGLYHSYYGWLLKKGYSEHVNPQKQAKDLINDPVYKFLERNGDWRRAHIMAFATCFGFRFLLLVCFGWVVALANLLAGFAVLQIPLMLNVICHLPKFGYKTFACEDDSVNVWWVGLLAFGEGWHNNHHAFPGSAKTGIKFFELDLSWLMILLMKRLGLARRVNVQTQKKSAGQYFSLRPVRQPGLTLAPSNLRALVRRKAAVPVLVSTARGRQFSNRL